MSAVDCIQVGNRTYDLGDILGVGGFSEVRKGVDKETRKRVALKIMYQDGQGQDLKSQLFQVQQEIKAMKKLNHPNLIRLLGYDLKCKVGTRKAIVMVQQLAPKGELFDYLMYTKKFAENQAVAVFKQLIAGLEAMHKQGIAHRDLKPENLLFDNQFQLKIADFGFSKVFQKKGSHKTAMATELGTKGYMAPEILTGRKYTEKADIFAAGVICFIMLAGFPPFQNADSKDWWFDKITKKKYKLFWMAHERTAKFSLQAKDILQKMLAATEADRLDVDGVKQTPFYNLPCLSKKEIAEQLKSRKYSVDQQKKEEKIAAAQQANHGNTRDTLLEIISREEQNGDAMPGRNPYMLRTLLQNNMAEKLGDVQTTKDLRSTLFASIEADSELFTSLNESFKQIDDNNEAATQIAQGLKAIAVSRDKSTKGLHQLTQGVNMNLGEKEAEEILKKLHVTKMGEIDDWEVAEKFAPLDEKKLPLYRPAVYKAYTYKTKIGFGMLGYCVSSFIRSKGTMKVLQGKSALQVTMALKKKVALPTEMDEVDANGEKVVKFRQGKINCKIEMLISIFHDSVTGYNIIEFENIGGAFTMQEFASCIRELTGNRTYYLSYFLEDSFNPTAAHTEDTEIPDSFGAEEEVAPAEQ